MTASNNPLRNLPTGGVTRELEQELVLKGTIEAREELVMLSLREAFAYLHGVSKGRTTPGEILSISFNALTRSAKNFSPGMQTFFAYSKAYLRGELFKAWREDRVVKKGQVHSIEGWSNQEFSPSDDGLARLGLNYEGHEEGPAEYEGNYEPGFEEIDSRERFGIIKPSLEKITAQERLVLELYYFGGMNFPQIGRLVSASPSAVQATHSRALRKVRKDLFRRKRLFSV